MKPTANTTETVDIFALTPGQVEIEILHPGTGEPLDFHVTLISVEDEKIKPIVRKHEDAKMKMAQRGKPMPASDIEEYGLNLVSSAIVGWRFGEKCTISFGEVGRPDYTPGYAKILLTRARFVLKQLDEALGDTSRFFRK